MSASSSGMVTLGRGQAYPLENYKKGARVWHRHPEFIWIGAELLDDITVMSSTIRLQLEDGTKTEISLDPVQLPFLRNPEILIGKDDLTALSYLHEPAVLHNLEYRFVEMNSIYTYCGIVLVAINPYANCSHLYTDDVIQVYRGVGKQVRELDPHIYAVAEEAFFDLSEYNKCQSIIVSGESGAGKTVSAKFVMKYLASIAGSKKGVKGIEDRVLASNPIMEAIGNAKTLRNDNSSRFGKFIQINFSERYRISGAEVKTYLLEKSRLVFQAAGERNYHVFYQMCAARNHLSLKGLHLGPSESYWYTSQGGDNRIPGVDDKLDFEETLQALSLLGFSEEKQHDIFRLLSGILLLGNVHFTEGDDRAIISPNNDHDLSRLCSSIYEIDEAQLRLWLTVREIRAAGEVVRKGLDKVDASRSRDALSKLLYMQLFNWLVDKVNDSLMQSEGLSPSKAAAASRKKQLRFIGVLDIYGFETFEINSFEQFCINYANEKLQQQFNQHVFKLEQEEYEREEIAWVRIDFYDNQQAIDLIEARPGLIDYLDEQCKVVKGSDEGWLGQITACPQLKRNPHLQFPKIRSSTFLVKHFAADVSYTVSGFMEKNKDSVSEQLLQVMTGARSAFLREIMSTYSDFSSEAANANGRRPPKKTVANQFRDSLRELMTVLCSTRPHYVRCIKPNDIKEEYCFEPKRVIQQLRANGVLETVRISAAGFPSRWPYDEFGKRYRVLYPEGKAMWRDHPKHFAENACKKWLEADKFALGKTKIFFRTGQVAVLERCRLETLSASAIKIQTIWRGFVCRRNYERIRSSVRTIQAACRAFLAYRRLKYLQMHRAAILLQANIRGYLERKRYLAVRNAVLAMQAHYRAAKVRHWVMKMRYEKSALTIQRYWRGYLVRRDEIKRIKKVIKVQSCVRRWLAKRRLRELKIEARSVGHLQKLNSGLENKIIELQMKLDTVVAERKKLLEIVGQVEMLRAELGNYEKDKVSWVETKNNLENLKLEVERLEIEVDVKEGQRAELANRLQDAEAKSEKAQLDSAQEMEKLRDELREATRRAKRAEEEVEKMRGIAETEKKGRMAVEMEMAAMREQLLNNANLLASPAFSRHGSMRQQNTINDETDSSMDGSIPPKLGSGDLDEIALILRQQQTINELRARNEQAHRENERLKSIVEANSLIDNLERKTSLRMFEAQHVQALEADYSKLKQELERLVTEKAESGYANMNLKATFDRIIEENERRREENAELKALLSNKFERQSAHGNGSPPPDSGTHSEDEGTADVEEELCLERQCRYLKALVENLSRDITKRNQDVERLEKRLNDTMMHESMRVSTTSQEDALRAVHGQLNNLTAENLSLNDKLLRQADELSDARAQLRGFTQDACSDAEVIRLESLHKQVEHTALLEAVNVPEFARIIISDFKPRLAKLLTKSLPSYLILCAFRFYDQAKDESQLTSLFSAVHANFKDTVSTSHDIDVVTLWFVNQWKLCNLLRQYAGDDGNPEWIALNTAKQNSHRINNYDMTPIREQLKLRIEECYQKLMKKIIEPSLTPKIVPAILQHESSSDITLATGTAQKNGNGGGPKGLKDLLNFLDSIYNKLQIFGGDSVLIGQVFRQICQWTCSLALNHMMFRKELCNFEKAVQIKHNVSETQSWLYQKGLGEMRETLEPLVQACHLLMSRKDEETICGELTSKLKPRQVRIF
ncbi:hypothetical protein WR25_17827 isoform B [Diploscapter pachys]|uniref:Myosin motor domain-containing protein n=1 Tax=Diploscapter pachys TaxID=2018661 RepID=A0A2A2KYS4_9BILA|nr:hypothetical protein WR25_17827 isoform B [Diploscapter pachys]